VTEQAVQRTIQAVWSLEAGKIIASLTRLVRDVGLAEELAQDALVAALEHWPSDGIPNNPAAWLMTTARNRALNVLARGNLARRKVDELGHEPRDAPPDLAEQIDDDVGDDLLRLIFIACHPVLAREARVALTLRMLGGLTTDEIARAFLVSEQAIGQRIVRAKRALADAKVPFELPRGEDRLARLESVLEVVYLIFNEGYAASAGDDPIRPTLCETALRLGRMLAALAPDEPEAHGLIALMELHASRMATRYAPNGDQVLLLDQDRARWDRLLIQRGLAALERAAALGGRGPYVLQAAISACHARATVAAETDWHQIAALYAELVAIVPSPVVELNRAMAVAMADGPAAGLAIIDALASEPALRQYHRLPAARGDLLFKLGRFAEARTELERAASLAGNMRDRELLLARAAECAANA